MKVLCEAFPFSEVFSLSSQQASLPIDGDYIGTL